MAPRQALSSQRGFTIVELMVAMIVLAVGILGTVAMVDTSNGNTGKTKAREGATNLGRGVLEIARAIPYKELTPGEVVTRLQAHPGFEDSSSDAGYQIRSRNFTYKVTVDVCSLDDSKDRLGTHDEAIDFCADSDGAAAGATGKDRNPDDYRRVTIGMTWKSPTTVAANTKQSGFITNPVGGLGPSVTALDPVGGSTTVTTTGNMPTASVSFAEKTSVSAAYVNWSIEGDTKGKATGSGTSWNFTWDLNELKAGGTLRYPDCTYVIQADAFDDKDRSGAPKALTMTLNRSTPSSPTGFAGGRSLNGDRVDLEWQRNPECDVVGYKVYRGVGTTTAPPASFPDVACTTSATTSECIDSAPALDPNGSQRLYYELVALDTSSTTGAQRPGTPSAPIKVDEGNRPPTTPQSLSACVGGNPGCLDIDGQSAPSGTVALSWDASTDPDGDAIAFYRLYRGGNTLGDRYKVLSPVAGKPLNFVDPNPLAGPNSYYVTAVDDKFGESAPTGAVTVTP